VATRFKVIVQFYADFKEIVCGDVEIVQVVERSSAVVQVHIYM